ncbi:hypothetical protein BD414DRAFT_492797 [Trametes punicea]|nr:hypothetical protein BD414DRAFT_492797 [Trametes punicea]
MYMNRAQCRVGHPSRCAELERRVFMAPQTSTRWSEAVWSWSVRVRRAERCRRKSRSHSQLN